MNLNPNQKQQVFVQSSVILICSARAFKLQCELLVPGIFVNIPAMKVNNLAASALLKSLEKHNIEKSLLLEGTNLKLPYVEDLHKTHNWEQFVKMFENCARVMGPEHAVNEVAYQGVYGENFGPLRRIAMGLINAKTLYWYLATFASKHLFKESLSFEYKKLKYNHIQMKVEIHPDLPDCPLLLKTYTRLYELVPTIIGLPIAEITTKIEKNKGVYDIHLRQTFFFKHILTNFFRDHKEDKDAIQLLGQLENQSTELSNLIDEKSQLLRIISHDISNQVMVIQGYLHKIARTEQLSPDGKQYLEIVTDGTKKLGAILKNVKNQEFMTLDETRIVQVNMGDIFLNLSHQFESHLTRKNIELKCQNDLPPNIQMQIEPTALETNILGNLLSNAIKFSHPGGMIELKAELKEGAILLSVADQGIGMSDEDRENCFTKKIRNSTAGTIGEKGTGFGLWSVGNYVRIFNGNISVRSNQPHGTVFTIEFKKPYLNVT